MKSVFRRPSPAMVVAIVALIAALGGTAVGAGVLNKKKAKKIANNVANTVVTQRASGLAVGDSAKLGGQGPSAFLDGVLAYGNVDFNGTTAILSGAKGISQGQVSHGSGNSVCFHDLGFTPHTMVATSLNGSNATTVWNSGLVGICGAVPNTAFGVITIGGSNDFTFIFN